MCAFATTDKGAKTRVVVMEDDLLYRCMLESILMNVGYEVILTGDGAEGMQAVRKYGADVVITDLFMPEQDGLQTIMQLKKEFPGIGVVAMSSGATYFSLENAREASTLLGADRFIEKPLNHQKLLDMVEGLLPPRQLCA